MPEASRHRDASPPGPGGGSALWPVRTCEPGRSGEEIEALVRRTSPRCILDIATGRGGVLQWLLEVHPAAACLLGVDVAIPPLKMARHALIGRPVALIAMDAASLAIRTASVDMVTIVHSLHHLFDVPRALREARRALAPGGWLVVTEMHRDDATDAQSFHIEMHAWWAAVDTATGVSHRPVYGRGQIHRLMAPLRMEDVVVIEDPGDQSQAHDPQVLKTYEERFDTYATRVRGHDQYEQLFARGQELKATMHEVGCAPPRVVIVAARKPRDD